MTVPAGSPLEHRILSSISQIDIDNHLIENGAIGDSLPDSFKALDRSFTVHFRHDPGFTVTIDHSEVGDFLSEDDLHRRLAGLIAHRVMTWNGD